MLFRSRDSKIGDNCEIGPYSNIRNHSEIKNNCRIGNFVEVKKSFIGENTKCAHLSYIGDCKIEENVNIGCGVIIANYDGKNKNPCFIGKNSFIGCNSILISPITINENSFVAAGTIVNKNLDKNSFAISRSELKISKRK